MLFRVFSTFMKSTLHMPTAVTEAAKLIRTIAFIHTLSTTKNVFPWCIYFESHLRKSFDNLQ
jgi:hypothetical protein